MRPPNRLLHLHLPDPITYTRSLRLQDAVLNKHWKYRDALKQAHSQTSDNNNDTTTLPSPPPPVILTFSTHPTYTVGRRHLTTNPLTGSQIDFLTNSPPATSPSTNTSSPPATFHPSPRGGLLTYHGPGQLTAYPIFPLRPYQNQALQNSPSQNKYNHPQTISPRNYISVLENTIISTCTHLGIPNTGRSSDPGVWILSPNKYGGILKRERKICAIGVQVSRGIAYHGVGLNVFDAPIPKELRQQYPFQDPMGNPIPLFSNEDTFSQENDWGKGKATDERGYLSWGFSRIVACGLEGKSVTWLSREIKPHLAPQKWDLRGVADVFAGKFVEGVNQAVGDAVGKGQGRGRGEDGGDSMLLTGVDEVSEEEILEGS